jgi:hypothetical protein
VAYGMSGNAARHDRIALGLVLRLEFHLVGIGSAAALYLSDMKVRAASTFSYPDVVVTCLLVAPDAPSRDRIRAGCKALSENV